MATTKPTIRDLPHLIRRWSLVIGHWSFPVGHFLFVICHFLLVICLPACTRPDDTWDRLRETGVLRVGMDASFPPFETIAPDGTLVGFDVDLARELARRLGPALSEAEGSVAEGIEVQFVANLPYDGLYDALAVGRVDVVISALVVNPARMADFAYSIPYFDAGQVLVVRAVGTRIEEPGPEPVAEMTDLGGRTLAVRPDRRALSDGGRGAGGGRSEGGGRCAGGPRLGAGGDDQNP
jgi:ABC-type amino acid transport substrate-binding protein